MAQLIDNEVIYHDDFHNSFEYFFPGRSKVFAKIFADQECSTNVIEIDDMKIDAFNDFLRFLYTAKISNLFKHAVGLFRAAMKVLWPGRENSSQILIGICPKNSRF
jgi:hypothetical protein